ncbi:MAG: hypothetical protein ACRDDZ_10440 [Marinifilaceae bacterium]
MKEITNYNGEPIDVRYVRWVNFAITINRAIDSCKTQYVSVYDQFREVTKIISLASGSQRSIPDFMLTSYTCYHDWKLENDYELPRNNSVRIFTNVVWMKKDLEENYWTGETSPCSKRWSYCRPSSCSMYLKSNAFVVVCHYKSIKNITTNVPILFCKTGYRQWSSI